MPDNDWRVILEHLDVASFYRSEGIEIRSGKALCPFHEDSRPSLSIDHTKGMFNCHACGAAGSVFDFYSRKHGTNFSAAVNAVAAFVGIPNTEVSVPVKKPTFSPETARNWWVNLRRSPEHLAYLHDKRGLTDETIDAEQLGWTGRRYSIPIRDATGAIINAKLYDPNATAGDKMLWAIKGTPAGLYIPRATAAMPEVKSGLLVEGEFDALVGAQGGLACYSGTAGARTWKKEWNDALPSTVLVLYDRDEAGDIGGAQAATSIAGSGKAVSLAQWPKGLADGYDLTDYMVDGGLGVADLNRDVLAGAVPVAGPPPTLATADAPSSPPPPATPTHGTGPFTFADGVAIVEALPHDLPPHEVMMALRPHLNRLTQLTQAELQMLYRGPLANHYKKTVGRSFIPTLLSEAMFLYKAKVKTKESSGPVDEELISDYKHMDLGQAWLDDTLFYTVTRGTIETVTLPDQVTTVRQPKFEAVFVSPQGMMKADTTALAREKFYLNGVKPHVNFNESWQSDPKVDHSWGWYLDHKTDLIDVAALYADVRDVFHRYLYVQDDPMFDTLACYTMMTYIYRIFRAVGYIWFRALRGSGKSRTLDIMQCLGFNSLKLIDPSDSFMYRKIAATSPLVLIDEAENMGAEQKQTLRTILNMGYMAGTGIGRSKVTDDDITEVQFDVFGPKVLASINDPDPTTADRCIVYDMERSPRNLPDFNSDRMYPKWVGLRNRLHCYGMQYASRMSVLAASLTLDDEGMSVSTRGEELSLALRNRDRQIWTPILTVALLVDEEMGNIATAPIFTKVLDFAKQYVVQKQSSIGEESEFQVVMAIRHYVRNNRAADGWYNSGLLLDHVRTVEGVYEKYSAKRLSSVIFNKLKLGSAGIDKKKMTGTRAMFYRLDAALLERKCKSYMLPDDDLLSFRESAADTTEVAHGKGPGHRPVTEADEAEPDEPSPMELAWAETEQSKPE